MASSGGNNFKVVLLGEGCVGKTSLVLRYVENKFNDKHISTLQVSKLKEIFHRNGSPYQFCDECVKKFLNETFNTDAKDQDSEPEVDKASFLNKKLNIGGKRVNIAIWDTAGQERFHALGPIYYRDSNGAILVYDITDEDSFSKVKNWVRELKKMLGNDICLCIAGNKIDLEKERHVSVAEAEEYASSVGAKHFHTSAKMNKGIEEMFLDLSKDMLEATQSDAFGGGGGGSSSRNKKTVTIVDDDQAETKSGGGCC